MATNSDQDGFKVPSLPISRTKPLQDSGQNEAEQQEAEKPPKLDETVTTRTEDKISDTQNTEQAKPAGEESKADDTESKADGTESKADGTESKADGTESKADGTEQMPSLSYVEPYWSGTPAEAYSLLIVKNGTEIGKLLLDDKPYHTFGRLPNCDVTLEHPSISRYHAILQYRPNASDDTSNNNESSPEAGFYVYDLGSTHGTYLNKQKVRPRVYCRLRVGQMVKFGGSTRLFILEASQLGQEAVEVAAEKEIVALTKYQEEMKKREQELLELQKQREAMEKEREETGATWGMVDDELDITSVGKADDAIDPEREAYYRDDPKKALKKYFDREDLELEYETVETGKKGTHCIRVSLPVQSTGGEQVVAEATVKGKRREAIVQCALEACRLLDSYGMLRQASQSRKKKLKNWEEDDFYSSDEDTFLDRTGIIEKKRHGRMKRLGKAEDTVETHDTLNKRLVEVTETLQSLEAKLAKSKKAEAAISKGDSLDVYMKSVKDKLDKGTIHEIKLQINKLKKEETKLHGLVKLTQPTELPALRQSEGETAPVVAKKNPHKKQYGLSRLPVDRKQAYLQETPTQQDPSITSDQCEVEYDSDEDTNNNKMDVGNSNSTSNIETKLEGSTSSDHSKHMTSVHEHAAISPSANNGNTKELNVKATDKQSVDSKAQPNDTTEDNSKDVISPKRTKLIGPSLGPLRKRRRRSSEPAEDISSTTQWAGDYDPDYASWLPPSDQSGDGKTHLNAKYGY